ncbi:MAG: tetratricopeptide repeat protein [Caldilineaceae bacterium]
MSNATTLAERLEQAGNSAAQSWVITELLLNAYPAMIRQSVIAAAVPHWFTAEILAALLDLSMEEVEERYAALQQLSIVQPFGDLGHTLHDLTRSGILAYLASNAMAELLKYSQRIHAYLRNQSAVQDSQMEVESIYHQLIFKVDEGRSALKTCARAYRNEGNFAAIENLLRNYRELILLGLLEPPDQVELERQEYWTAEALAERGKEEKGEQGTRYLRKALEQFVTPEQLPKLLAIEPEKWREQIDTYKHNFVLNRLETARQMGDLARQPLWLAELGDIYRNQGNLEASLQKFNLALQFSPKDAWILAYRAYTYRLMKHYEEALIDFDHAIRLEPQNAWIYEHRGITYRLIARYEEALSDFDSAIAFYSYKNAIAIAGRGETYRLMGRYEEALTDFDQAIALDKMSAWAVASRGQVYQSLKRYKEALADLDRAITLDDTMAWAVAYRGETYRLLQRYEEALADFNRAIVLNEKYAWAIASRGETYNLMARYEEALADFNRVIQLDEKYTWAIASRGQVYQALKRYKEALVDFDHAIQLDEKYVWAINRRGLVYLLLGRKVEAQADLNQALSLNEDDWYFYWRGLSYLVQNQLIEAQSDLIRAIELANLDYAKNPQDWRNTLNLMLYHLVAGNNSMAERFLQEAFDGNASIPPLKAAIQDLEELLIVLPDHTQARIFLQRIEAYLGDLV